MTSSADNALRSVARRFRVEILKAIGGGPKLEHDRIITSLLDKHAKTVHRHIPGKALAVLLCAAGR